jgi:cyclophilin family peptidyl-prolyl cis-trans isomerase/HEAT repeat protein
MTPLYSSRLTALVCGVLLSAGGCTPADSGRPDRTSVEYLQIIALEDARPTGGEDLAALVAATETSHDYLRQTAVRALGRLENPELVEEIAKHLEDPVTEVRAHAVDALAQAVHRSEGAATLEVLLSHLTSEEEAAVRGVYAHSLGRLQLKESDRVRAIDAILGLSMVDGEDAHPATLEGVALGLEATVRSSRDAPISDRLRGRLSDLVSFDRVQRQYEPLSAQVRLLALSALGQAGEITTALVEGGLSDANPRVRMMAAQYLGAVPLVERPDYVGLSLLDESVGVRSFAVQQLAREERDATVCGRLLAAATRDQSHAVRVLALDALAEPCPNQDAQKDALLGTASSLGPETRVNWQVGAHALVSLASLAPEFASRLVPVYTAHSNPFVRAYGARAASVLGQTDILLGLAGDPAANVRTTVLQRLAQDAANDIDQLLVSQMSSDDPQLLITAAGLLEGSDLGFPAASAALAAFERISGARRETWRDSRAALLTLAAELGSAALADRLTPFLSDYDAVIAEQVADVLELWTGRPHTAEAQPLPRNALPRAADLPALFGRTVVLLHMQKGGTIAIQPLPRLALTNAHRFVRLAQEGYFDGLTFHRWAPNFVLQGGSPGANEYSGDGSFSRDEVGAVPHWRGTVGLSTRGHDTGDGQIFINLVDNVRLDHDYTVYGIVVGGMELVDGLLEGDVITRAEVIAPP